MRAEIAKADLVISLLPATMHVPVAKMCIAHQKHLVTASYTSPDMRGLDLEAREAGVIILNEVGLDPGIDHMSAQALINEAKERGAVITSFESVCGGLPAPEASDNPFGYKFSWNPRGVLTASQNDARYLKDGKVSCSSSFSLSLSLPLSLSLSPFLSGFFLSFCPSPSLSRFIYSLSASLTHHSPSLSLP